MSPLPVRVDTKASALPVGEYSGRDSVAGCDTSSRASPPAADGAAQISPPDDERDLAAVRARCPARPAAARRDWPCEVIDVSREHQAESQRKRFGGCACGEASHKAGWRHMFKLLLNSEDWNLQLLRSLSLVAGFAAGWLLASRSRASSQDQLRDTFQALAASTLKTSTDEFLKLADQKIGNVHREAAIDLTRRQQELGTLVTPIKDTLRRSTRS